ncbi:hypothetical protein D0838_05175 [Bordetella avium]|uniref:hypothetical protein n=1 Tax=Bordetella avium TaxID=521 RepID=UPI000E68FD5F|nr:hypothetical protein [Bordetella avium]RIQ74590.1 hypothetical protein D0838_05175 [Bordetella avium]
MAKATLKGGIVGRLNMTMWVAIIAIAGICIYSDNLYLQTAGVASIVLLVLQLGNRLINFANKNPAAALLDGGEFVAHQGQILMANKGSQIAIPAPDDRSESDPIDSDPGVIDVIAEQPDPAERMPPNGGR